MRGGAALFNELRNAVFAAVTQNAIRRVALETFNHVPDFFLNDGCVVCDGTISQLGK